MGIGSSGNGGIPQTVATYTSNWSGAWTSPQSITVIAQKYGNLVCLDISGVAAEGQLSTSALSSAGMLASDFRPAANVYEHCAIISNGALVANPGKLAVTTAGSMIIYFDATEADFFSGSGGNNGWQKFSITYYV